MLLTPNVLAVGAGASPYDGIRGYTLVLQNILKDLLKTYIPLW